MSKRDMRAKKLLLAVLLAMSMQSYYAAPTWAAEAGQPAGQTETVDGKGQSDGTTTPAADEAETVKKTDTKQEADEALTIMGYSVNTLNADEDAGIMPTLVGGYTGSYNAGTGSNYTVDYATAVGYNAVVNHLNSTALGYNASTSAEEQVSFGHWDSTTSTWTTTRSLAGIKNIEMAGALTGVTTINGANFTVDETNGNIAIGILAKIESSNPSSETIHVVALGERAAVTGLGGVAVGFEAHAYAEEATALGYCAEAYSKYSIAIGSGAQAREENNIVIGTNSDSIGADSVVIGSGAFGDARNSIAIGAGSSTETDNEVNFGYYNLLADGSADMGNPYFGRSLAGISSIDFIADIDGNKGAITGLSSINGVTVVGTDASTGLTVGGNAIIGKTDIPFSSNGFSVNNTGAITAASGTIGGITLNGGKLDKITSINGANFTTDNNSIAVGALAIAEDYGSAFGLNSQAKGSSSVAIGNTAKAKDSGSIAIGSTSIAEGANSIAIGVDNLAEKEGSIAIGTSSYAENIGSIALGSHAEAPHDNSVAIGSKSFTTADNQVAFGTGTVNADKTVTWTNRRSLAGISDIEMHGGIMGLTSINGVAVSGSTAAGLTIGGITLNNGGIIGEVTEDNYKMKINGLDFYTGINEEWDKGSMAFGKDSVIGNITGSTTFNAIAIGTGADAESDNAIALGAHSLAYTEDDMVGNAMAIGAYAGAYSSNSVAFGYQAYVARFDNSEEHNLINNSMALGTYSSVNTSDTVSFGHKVGDGYGDAYPSKTYTDNLFRSLVNVKDIELNTADDGTGGAITGLTSINGVYFSAAADQSHLLIGSDERTSTNKNNTGIGVLSVADGDSTVAVGYEARAAEDRSIAIGAYSKAYAADSIVIGEGSEITNTGLGSIALGRGTKVVSQNSIAIGNGAHISDENQLFSVAIGADSTTSKETQVSFGHKQDDLDAGGSSFGHDLFRSVVNVADIEMHGGITGLTSIEGVAVSGSAAAGLTVSGVTLNGGKVNEVALGLKGGAGTDKDNVLVGGVDLTALSQSSGGNTGDITALKTKTEGIERTGDGSSTPYATTIEGVTLSSNKVTASGGIVVDSNNQLDAVGLKASKVNGATITSNTFNEVLLEKDAGNSHYKVGDVDVTALSGTVGDATKGLVKDTADLKTAVGDADTGLAAVNTKVGTNIAAITAINERTAGIDVNSDSSSKFSNGFTVGSTSFGMGSDGALTAKTINTVTIEKVGDAIKVGDIDLTALSQNSGGNTGDITALKTKTEGIERTGDGSSTPYATTIEGVTLNSNKVTASGGIVVDSNNQLDAAGLKASKVNGATITSNTFNEVLLEKDAGNSHYKVGDVDVTALSDTIGDATKGLVKDTADLKTAVGAADTGLAAVNTKVTDLQTATTGMSYDSGTTSTSFSGNVVVGNVGNQTHTQITDNAIIFGQGAEKQVTVDASGIHVGAKAMNGISTFADSNGTHIDHTSLVTGTVTAANLNGVAISGNATDGLSVGGVNIKTLDDRLATLKTTVDDIQNSGVGPADMAGVQRSDADGDGINDTTTIETATSFTKAGMKTSNLEALTAAIGGVNFAAGGVVTGINSINGTVFSSDGKIGGVSLSGGKVNGVDIKWLDQRVTSLEGSGTGGGGTGGGGGASTSGIGKPDGDTTTIEGNTTVTGDGIETNKVTASDQIIVADGKDNQTVISEDGIKVAEGKTNEVTINDKGIHVGKNSSVMNDTEGFITDKGLYIGVNSSNDISTAKFSVDKGNGTMTSKVGGYTFTNGSSGAVFSHSGDTAVTPGGSFTETTIKGNKVTTGRLDADELYVDGNKVNIAGGTIGQTDAVANHLEGTDGDGNKVTNDFKTSALNGTTQAAEQTSADGKNIIKTENNTSAGGTSVTTSKTSTNSADRKTEQSSSFVTNESGMSLNTSTKVTDKDGNVTKNTSGETKMSGDSLTVSKTTVTSKDGKEETTTSSTTVGSGEVTLHREDGSTIRVGEAIEGMQGQIQDIGSKVNEMGVEIKEVGALSAALAGLHPQPENANSRADFAMAMGSYEGKQALAVGGFYRPDKRTMLSIGASTTSSKHMMNMGISIALDKLPEAERNEQESNADLAERMKKLEADYEARLEKMEAAYEARMERLEARYARMKDAYEADKEQQKQQEVADETQENAEAASA